MSDVVFPTCVVELSRPRLARRIATWLRGRGRACTVAGGAGCCGQPAWNAGYTDDARRVARGAVRALARRPGTIVVPSGSCSTMIRRHWPELFAGTRDAAAALAVSSRVEELSEHVVALVGGGCRTPDAAGVATAYHASCHMRRELGIVSEPLALLAACGRRPVDVDSADQCCGFGGTFSVKFPELSVAMADARLDAFIAGGVTEVVSADLSCLLHLEGRARRRELPLTFRHIAEVVVDIDRG